MKGLGFTLLLAAAYFVAGKVSLLLAIPPGYATAVWPPAGIALGALLLLGNRCWPGVWLGSFLTHVATAFDGSTTAAILQSVALAASIGGGAALQAAVGASLVRRFLGFPLALSREREIFMFFALGGAVASLLNATVGVLSLLLFGKISPDAVAYSWGTWWAGDAIGTSIFAPLMLIWFGGQSWLPRRIPVTVALAITFAGAILMFVFTSRLEWTVLVAGLLFSALVGAGALAVTGRTAMVEALVHERTAELAAINERLAKADRIKSEFISTVSHELRTPLTSIRGSLGLLGSGALRANTAKAGQLIDIAYRNTDRLVLLIDDILDIEKLESGNLSMAFATVSLPALIRQAVEANNGYAQSCDVRFMLQKPLPEVRVAVDADRLLQVMANLLSNAVKFSPAGSLVEIGMTVLGAQCRVFVKDRGPGIAPEFQPRIFHRFSQADSADSRAKGGSGLGLAISKSLLERMGGTIGYETDPGHGAMFFFDLPILADAGAQG